MKISQRDWIFAAVIAVVLGALFLGKGKLKAGNTPDDNKHRQFYEAMSKGGERIAVEKGCTVCHGPQSTPLSKSHPPKEQCLICHTLS
jgi:cbb3-type cytochrome oxidase cytochrome c subunit